MVYLYVQTSEVMKLDNKDNAQNIDCRLNGCLFFSSAKLSRLLGKIADDAFKLTGLSPSHALLLYLVNENNVIHQKTIGEILHLTPSTITRFVEKLEDKKLVCRTTEGKNVYIHSTEKGMQLQPNIIRAWNTLQGMYGGILTQEESRQFIAITSKLMKGLENQDN